MHITGRLERIERDLNNSTLELILINSLASFNRRTGLAEILANECLVSANGYEPVQLPAYTAGSATDNQTLDRTEAPPYTGQFSSALSGETYEHSHVALLNRSGMANKPASLNVATDVITCTAHGLQNGDRAILRSTGALPGGAVISGGGYYVTTLSANTLELYTDPLRTLRADFTTVGSGDLYLQNCTGAMYEFLSNPGTINPGQTKTFQVIYWVR